MEPNQVVDAI